MSIIIDNAIASSPAAVTRLGWAALGSYVVAVLCFGIGLVTDGDVLRDVGLGFGIIGLVLDMRHYTARGITRLIHTMSLWQDGDAPDPQHRRGTPTSEVQVIMTEEAE